MERSLEGYVPGELYFRIWPTDEFATLGSSIPQEDQWQPNLSRGQKGPQFLRQMRGIWYSHIDTYHEVHTNQFRDHGHSVCVGDLRLQIISTTRIANAGQTANTPMPNPGHKTVSLNSVEMVRVNAFFHAPDIRMMTPDAAGWVVHRKK